MKTLPPGFLKIVVLTTAFFFAGIVSAQQSEVNRLEIGLSQGEYVRILETITGVRPLPNTEHLPEKKRFIRDRYLEHNMEKVRAFFVEQLFEVGYDRVHAQEFDDAKGAQRDWAAPRDGNGMNLFVDLPGKNPQLGKILVVSHYDTTGKNHPGANDNGTGVAAVLSLARTMKALNIMPERTIRFALTDGEEIGILGSRNYVNQMLLSENPAERISLMINIDMIGDNFIHSNELMVYTGKYQSELSPLLEKVQSLMNTPSPSMAQLARGGYKYSFWDSFISDNMPFERVGVPVIAFFENPGSHVDEDYYHPQNHKKTDTMESIDVNYATRIMKFVGNFLYQAGQQIPEWQTADHRAKLENERRELKERIERGSKRILLPKSYVLAEKKKLGLENELPAVFRNKRTHGGLRCGGLL